jgi:Vacuolar sorting protein 39 domain 2
MFKLKLEFSFSEDRRKELVEPALDLINRRAKMFNMAKVLEVLPQELSVTVIDSFLRGALRSSMHQVNTHLHFPYFYPLKFFGIDF